MVGGGGLHASAYIFYVAFSTHTFEIAKLAYLNHPPCNPPPPWGGGNGHLAQKA